MPVKVRCTGCQKVLTAPDQARGKAIKCPNCETRVSVPAADAASVGKKKKAAAEAPDSESAIATLDLRSLEDTAARVCPKCGYDMTHYDEETTECPKCGYDAAAGGLGEKARKKQLKGPDPDKFYAGLWKGNWKFVLANQSLAWRTILYTLVASLMTFGSVFMYLWVSPVPPRAFFALCTVVSAMMIPGWLWFLDQELVKASLERKDKLKRINLDIFLCSALGVKFVAWHVVFVGPLLALPALVGWALVQFGGMPPFMPAIVAGVCYLPVLSMLPIVMGHMVMPIQAPGWMFWKVVPAWLKVIQPCLLWLLLLLGTCLPAIGCVAAIGAVYGPSLQAIAQTMDHNAAITRAKLDDERKSSKDETKGKNPLLQEQVANVDFFPIVVPSVLWVVACLCMGFPALYLMRVNGQLVYFFRDHLNLQALAKEYKYVAKEKADEDEEAKPKTMQQVLLESGVGAFVCLMIGLVYGYVSSSMNNTPMGIELTVGLFWGARLGFFSGMCMLAKAAWDHHPGFGVLVSASPTAMVVGLICSFLIGYVPALAIVAGVFGLLALAALIGALVFTAQHWQEARSGCLMAVFSMIGGTVCLALMFAGVVSYQVLMGIPTQAPAQQAPSAPGMVDEMPADDGTTKPAAPQIPGQNLPGAEVLDPAAPAAFRLPNECFAGSRWV